MRICFVSVPYDTGKYNVDHGLGPRSLMSAGLDRLLSESGFAVDSKTIICDSAEDLTDVQVTFKLNALLSEAVSRIVEAGTFPVILAGNCISSVGVVSGLHNADLRVLWLDAHADFNTPETTLSGYLDGMALSTACGRCWKLLSASDPRFLALSEEHVTLAGSRDLDPEERRLLGESKIRTVSAERLRKNDLQLPDEIGPAGSDLYIHLDADVLDKDVGHANRFASKGGLQVSEIESLLSWAISSYHVEALGVTAYGPDHDGTGAVRTALSRIIISAINAIAARQ
jgi:arginase